MMDAADAVDPLERRQEVPISNSQLFLAALQENGIKRKILTYEKGGHGYALGRRNTDAVCWSSD